MRLLAIPLAVAFLLGGGSSEKPRLSKSDYLAALSAITSASSADRLEAQVLDFDLPGAWPTRESWLRSERQLSAETERVADRIESLRPPAEVADAQAEFVASLRFCARRVAGLEHTSPLDAIIAERELEPCIAAHRRACEKYWARDYSWS